jgi:GT2 family glycosyltransferase
VSAERVAVVLVNYNGAEHLPACLAALAAQSVAHRTLVVDNASRDGSARSAHAAFPDVAFIPLRRNVGFARAVNLAAERLEGSADVLVTLNPDTVPAPEFLEQLLVPLHADPEVASVAGTLVFASRPDVIASAGIVVHRNGVALDARLGEPRPAPGSDPEAVFGASGGAAAFRLAAFRAVGGFPEAFFMYLEDVDLAWRLRAAGWRAVWAPGALATHAYSATAREGSPFKRRLLARNRLWTLARCLPREAWARDWRSIVWFDIVASVASLVYGDWAALRGRVEGILGLPLRLSERTKVIQQASTCRSWALLDPWIAPPISIRRLLRLRRMTARLAAEPNRTAER